MAAASQVIKIEISLKSIAIITSLILFFVLINYFLPILLILFVSFIIMSALEPLVQKLIKFHIPRTLAIFLCYIVLIALFIGLIFIIVSSFLSQSQQLTRELPSIPGNLVKAFPFLDPILGKTSSHDIFKNLSSFVSTYLNQFSTNIDKIYSTSVNIFTNASYFIAVIVISIYMLIDRQRNSITLIKLVPKKYQKKFKDIVGKIQYQLGTWLIGQILLGTIVGVMYWIALTILGMKYTIPLAMLAAIFELIPIVGSIITGILVVVISIAFNPAKLIPVIIASFLIQETEGHLLVPKIMDRVVGISPLFTIVALFLASEMLGITGALIAVPLTAVIQILVEELI